MKKHLLLFFFLPAILFGQIQVSEINFELPRDDYPYKGFIKVEQEEYFIEQGLEGTKVSLVKENDLIFLHELKFRPTNSSLNKYISSNKQNNSGLIHKGPILYEIYNHYIYSVDIVSGKLLDIIDFKLDDLRIFNDIEFGVNFIYFKALGKDAWQGAIRFDKNSKKIDTLENNGTFSNSSLYWIAENKSELRYLDLETNQISNHPFLFSNIEFIRVHESDQTTHLIIKDESGIHLLKDNDIVSTISCNIPEISRLIYVSNDVIAYETDDVNGLVFTVIELNNCANVYTQSFAKNSFIKNISVYQDETVFNEYFIYGFPNDWQGNGLFFLYDIKNKSASQINIPIDVPFLNTSVRYGDNLYFLSSNHIHYIGSLPELYKINLKTKNIERINNNEIYKTWNVVIGEHQDDRQLNAYFKTEKYASLNKVDDLVGNIENVIEFDLNKNHGINSTINEDIWVDDKYFFITSNAIFVLFNDITKKLIDIDPSYYGYSAFKHNGDFLYLLTSIDNASYVLKIDIKDFTFNKSILPDVIIENPKRMHTENAIINTGRDFSSSNFAGFYDIAIEQYVRLSSLGLTNVQIKSVSGNSILCKENVQNNNYWYIVNTKTREVVLSEIKQNTFPKPYPDSKGGFYMEGWYYDSANDVSFKYLDKDGKLTTIFENFNYLPFYGGEKIDGNVKSIAYDGTDNMIILSMRDGDSKMKLIPDNDLRYYQHYFWYESDNISFVDVHNGQSYDTYTFNFDNEPEKISNSGRPEELTIVLEGVEYSILIYLKSREYISFEKYTYSTGILEKIKTIYSVDADILIRDVFKISNSKYILSFDDRINGLEPWLFDIETGGLTNVADMRTGFLGSNISDFTISPLNNDVYFSAIRSEGDRQLFKLKRETVTTKEEYIPKEFNVKLYPVPANNHISLDRDFDEVTILTVNHKELIHINPYIKDQNIQIQNLTDGLYILHGKSKNESRISKSFIIIRQ